MTFKFSFHTINAARKTGATLALLVCACLLLAACAKGNAANGDATSSNLTRYSFKGIVKSVNVAKRLATIKHEKVGDFMEPMTMPFLIKDEAALKRMQPGDSLQATLVVTDEGGQWLEQVTIQPRAQARLAAGKAVSELTSTTPQQQGGAQ